jgi:hypothetical protein
MTRRSMTQQLPIRAYTMTFSVSVIPQRSLTLLCEEGALMPQRL